MHKKRPLISILSGTLALSLTLGSFFHTIPLKVQAEKSSQEIKLELDSLNRTKEEIDSQMQKLEDDISANNEKIEDLAHNKNILDQQIFLLHEKIITVNQQILAHNALIADNQEELEQAEANLRAVNQKYKERIRAMEEAGHLSYWSVLFQAHSFADLLDRMVMMDEIASADQRRLDELREASRKVAEAREKLEIEKAELDQSRQQLEEAQKESETMRQEADEILNQLLATGVEYQDLLNKSAADTNQLMDEISKLDQQYDEAKEREYQEWLAQQEPPKPPETVPPTQPPTEAPTETTASSESTEAAEPETSQPAAEPTTEPTTPPKPTEPVPPPIPEVTPDGGDINWLVPVNYTMVSSPFGYRIHPIYGTWKLHAGIDLAAPTGQPIVASRGGVVTTASYEEGGAGYYVSINHFDGYSTRYMHMTHYIVQSGQKVQAGQVIGYVGSTGASTGPHLHFGVYLNGVPINPAPFIGL